MTINQEEKKVLVVLGYSSKEEAQKELAKYSYDEIIFRKSDVRDIFYIHEWERWRYTIPTLNKYFYLVPECYFGEIPKEIIMNCQIEEKVRIGNNIPRSIRDGVYFDLRYDKLVVVWTANIRRAK